MPIAPVAPSPEFLEPLSPAQVIEVVLGASDPAGACLTCSFQFEDMIVLDLLLPNVDGLDVCKHLKSDPTDRNAGRFQTLRHLIDGLRLGRPQPLDLVVAAVVHGVAPRAPDTDDDWARGAVFVPELEEPGCDDVELGKHWLQRNGGLPRPPGSIPFVLDDVVPGPAVFRRRAC